MKKLLFTLALVFITMGANAQMSLSSFKSSVKSQVAKLGYVPSYDSDGDIQFMVEGDDCWIIASQEDDGYFYVVMDFDPLSCTDTNTSAVLQAVNRVTREYKVGKCYYSTQYKKVHMRIEFFCATPNECMKYFSRYLKILRNMQEDVKDYYEEYDN